MGNCCSDDTTSTREQRQNSRGNSSPYPGQGYIPNQEYHHRNQLRLVVSSNEQLILIPYSNGNRTQNLQIIDPRVRNRDMLNVAIPHSPRFSESQEDRVIGMIMTMLMMQLIASGSSEEDAINIIAQMLEKSKVNREEIKEKQTKILQLKQQIYGPTHYNSDQTECPVCMEGFNDGDKIIVGSTCDHISHYDCILEWAIQQVSQGQTVSCPLDRLPI